MSTPVAEAFERLQCRRCQSLNEKAALSCRSCGAPLDARNLVSESGWREAPRIRDMAEIHFSNSTCQVEGEIVPVSEISLSPGDAVPRRRDASEPGSVRLRPWPSACGRAIRAAASG